MVNPRADPPIIKMMMSERTPPTTEADKPGKINQTLATEVGVFDIFAVCSVLSPTLCYFSDSPKTVLVLNCTGIHAIFYPHCLILACYSPVLDWRGSVVKLCTVLLLDLCAVLVVST